MVGWLGSGRPDCSLFRLRPERTANDCRSARSIHDAAISVSQQEELGLATERLRDMSTKLQRLSAGEITLEAIYASRRFVQQVDAAKQQGVVELRAPRPERVPLRVAAHVAADTVLSLSIFAAADDRGRMHLQLHCVDGTWQPAGIPIYPGKYLVRCSGYASGDDHEITWIVTEGDTKPRWRMR